MDQLSLFSNLFRFRIDFWFERVKMKKNFMCTELIALPGTVQSTLAVICNFNTGNGRDWSSLHICRKEIMSR